MKKFFINAGSAFIASLVMLFFLSGCGNSSRIPSAFIGEWNAKISYSERVKIDIKKDGDFKLTIYQSGARYDVIYSGSDVEVNKDLVKLHST